ncbi:Protein of unknown function [Pyronema omphalodes CBS 100304]|uniref:Uncharacterized protein n=1 Tax=Pyronema omphalodes (strain CBS 100304) TaxID=1076935 RepID=U4KTW4_PYROM|nr:Protein of unknown function [Pyronema omphalodes CBS 100304]
MSIDPRNWPKEFVIGVLLLRIFAFTGVDRPTNRVRFP